MEEEYRVRHIPDNYENGIHIAGFSFKPLFLIEGAILACILAGLSFLVLRTIGLSDMGQMIGICLVFGGAGLFIGIKGINDEPITTYLQHASRFKKGRRTAYYNPRIKEEAKSLLMEEKQKEVRDAVPREKILMFFNKYKDAIDKKQQEKAKAGEEDFLDKGNLYFEDDIGILKKPKEYYSDKENKDIVKKKKKMKRFKDGIDG